MTRFARAKGSKSSNERVPDEATPWNVMKMQLEDSATASTSVKIKAKNAKELLAEKDDDNLFYSDTRGNVNHEWASFEEVGENGLKKIKNESEKTVKTKNDRKDKKKKIDRDSNEDRIGEVAVKIINNQTIGDEIESSEVIDKCESNKSIKKKKKINANEVEEIVECKNAEKRKIDEVENCDSKSKKKNRKKLKKLKSAANDGGPSEPAKLKTNEEDKKAISDIDKSEIAVESVEKLDSEKLSKRQKRNKKHQKKIMGEKNDDENLVKSTDENPRKEENSKNFDVEGNDWSNEVKFGKQVNPRRGSGRKEVGEAVDRINGDEDNYEEKKKEKDKKRNEDDSNSGKKNDNELRNETTAAAAAAAAEDSKDHESRNQNQKRKGGKNEKKEYKRRKPDEGVINMIINGNEVLVVKYDGFPVKKEDADRLKELKKNMIIKGIPRSEINIAMKLERRKAEKALARERKRVCFHCRKSGHNLSDCPELGRDEAGTGICFKCGSAEHTHFECKVVKTQEFRHASCFICREQGHIARQCPDNPKGLYPQGGSCKLCGDVTHLKKDCPDLIKEKEETNITADKIITGQLEALQEDSNVKTITSNQDNKIKNKIIKF